MKPRVIFGMLKTTFNNWTADKASRLAAALAYYTAFSLAPLLVIVIGIAGLAFGQQAAQGGIVGQLEGLLGHDSAHALQVMVQKAGQHHSGLVQTVFGVVTLALGATGVFAELQDGLNTVWEVRPKPARPVVAILKERFTSFTMVLAIAFLLLVSLSLSAGLAAFNEYLKNFLPGLDIISQVLNFVISFGVITLLFAMIFKILPDVTIGWRDVWTGAVVTALLFTVGKYLIGVYLGRGGVSSWFGAAGSLVIILVWVYYSAQILFLGAEFTKVYANKYGSRIAPAPNAEPVTKEARAQAGMPERKQNPKR